MFKKKPTKTIEATPEEEQTPATEINIIERYQQHKGYFESDLIDIQLKNTEKLDKIANLLEELLKLEKE